MANIGANWSHDWTCARLLAVACAVVSLAHISTSHGFLAYRTTRLDRAADVPDILKKTPDFIEKNGYVAETHDITTEDGYILSMHRVPREKIGGKHKDLRKGHVGRPIVMIQHGISGSSDNWVLGGPKSFPFILADRGYDVWLSNSRGNSYCKRHINLTLNDQKFWDFSFHEQGYYDLAASIDYALNTTGQKNLYLIGHSRGTTSSYALLSTRPEYNDKVRLLISYAPVAYIKHARGALLQAFLKNTSMRQAKKIMDDANVRALPGLSGRSAQMRNTVCGPGASTLPLCVHLFFLLNGVDRLMNKTMAPVLFTHFPDGGAVQEFLHYLQIAKTDKFTMFDRGDKENLRMYGTIEPPRYPLERITAPASFHYADNDYIVSMPDLLKLVGQISNVAGVFRVPFNKFNHINFMLGTETEHLLYEPTMKLMQRY